MSFIWLVNAVGTVYLPIVAIVLVLRRKRGSAIDRALDAEEEEELLREARQARFTLAGESP